MRCPGYDVCEIRRKKREDACLNWKGAHAGCCFGTWSPKAGCAHEDSECRVQDICMVISKAGDAVAITEETGEFIDTIEGLTKRLNEMTLNVKAGDAVRITEETT